MLWGSCTRASSIEPIILLSKSLKKIVLINRKIIFCKLKNQTSNSIWWCWCLKKAVIWQMQTRIKNRKIPRQKNMKLLNFLLQCSITQHTKRVCVGKSETVKREHEMKGQNRTPENLSWTKCTADALSFNAFVRIWDCQVFESLAFSGRKMK